MSSALQMRFRLTPSASFSHIESPIASVYDVGRPVLASVTDYYHIKRGTTTDGMIIAYYRLVAESAVAAIAVPDSDVAARTRVRTPPDSLY